MEFELENKDTKAAQLYKLFSKHKTLATQNCRSTRFSWLQKVANVSLIIKFFCPNFPSSAGCEVTGDDQALFLLKNLDRDYQKHIANCRTFEEVLDWLSELVRKTEEKAEVVERSLSVSSVEAEGRVLEDILSLGWERLSHVSSDLRTVTLTSGQPEDRELVVRFPPDYPTSPLTLHHWLPPCWTPPTSSLAAVHCSWTAALQDYRPAWRQLQELDRLCWVLDSTSTRQLHRRIAVDSYVSLQVEVDPSHPTGIPTVKFLGSTDSTEQLRKIWVDNIELWDDEDPVLTNLERVLALEFPSGESRDSESQGSGVECGICLEESGEDEGEVASIGCEDSKCKASFHPSCLYQWLLRAPTRRTCVSGTVAGSCPLCQRSIFCSKPAQF